MEVKSIFKSKTFWFNVLALLIAAAGSFGFAEFQPDVKVFEYAGIVIALINVVLRFVTKQPVALKK